MKKVSVLLMSLFLVSCSSMNSGEQDNDTDNQTTEAVENIKKETEIKEYGFIDNRTIDHKDFSLKIKDIWIEEDEYDPGTSLIAFEYEVTNKTDEGMGNDSPFMFYMQAVQDNDPNVVNSLEFASPKQYGLEEYKEVKPGGTTIYGMAFRLKDNTTPVTLKLKDDMFQELDEQEYGITDLEHK